MKSQPTSAIGKSTGVAIADRLARILMAPVLLVALLLAMPAVLTPAPAWAASFLERAQQYFDDGDFRSAEVELKNALQRDPDSAEARFLLGKVHLRFGDPLSAEKEFLRARDLGLAGEELDLMLAHARLEQRRFDDVVSSLPDDLEIESKLQMDLYVARGEALMGLGRFEEAEAIFDRILEVSPHARALTNKARIATILGDKQAARELLDQALEVDPNDPLLVAIDAAWLFQAQRFEEAKARFTRAVELDPIRLGSYLGKIQSHLALGEIEEADKVLQFLKASRPDSLMIVLQESIILLQRGDYLQAKIAADRILTVDANQRQALLVAGFSAYRLASYEQATARLSAYLSQNPGDERARAVLAASMLKLGRSQEAYDTMNSLEGGVPDSAAYLGVLAGTAFGAGDREAGLKYLERLASERPTDAVIQEKLGVARVSTGDVAGGTEAFEQSIALAPERLDAYSRLFAVQLQQEQPKLAEELANKVREKFPTLAAGDTMLGMALLSQGETDRAKAAFQSAVERDPGNAEAANNLASILHSENEPGKARTVLQGVVDADPGNLRTLLAIAAIDQEAGNNKSAEETLLQAVRHNPRALQPRLALANIWLKEGRAADALAVTEQALPQNPNNPPLLHAVSLARMQTGDLAGATALSRRLVEVAPGNLQAQEVLMMVLERDGKIDEALAAAERTLELEPGAAIPALARVRYLAQLGRLNEAKEGLAPLKQRFSDHVEVLTTEGRIALIERRQEDALGIFERAFDLQPDNTRVVDLTKTGVSLGRSDKYLPIIDSWLEENPEQLGVREKFSEMLIVVGKLPEAKQQYELILERSPNNAQALNNLAWLQVELGEAAAAVATGRRAVQVAPGNPAPLDTLAVALLETGEKKEALELLTAANKAAPQDPDIRFHLARALAANGDTAGAVLTLKSLLESDARFRQRSQAVALLESLSQQ